MVQKILIGLLIFIFSISTCEAANLNGKTEIKDLRYSLGSGTVRIVLDVGKKIDFTESYAENPSRLIVTLKNAWIDVTKMKRDIELASTAAKRIKVAQFDDSTVRVVVETMADVNIFWLDGGPAGNRLVVDVGNATFKPNEELNKKQQEKEKPKSKKDDKKSKKEIKNKSDDDNLGEEVDTPFDEDEDKKAEQKEKERKEKERKERERERKERKEKERKEKERKEKEEKEKERKEKERKEKERKEKERKEKNKKDKKSKNDREEEQIDEPFEELEEDLDKILTLEGKKICIDAGHGGGDAGAIGPTGVTEKSVTLRVALQLRDLLEEEGAEVIMTRTTDKPVSPKGDKASAIEELQARCDVANREKVDIFISIHADSFTNPAARGSTGYYYSKTEGTSAKRLADAIRRGVCEQLRTPSRGTQPCNFYVVRHTDMAATLVELAFISNAEEEKLLDSEEGIEKAAHGIFDGIEDYFG